MAISAAIVVANINYIQPIEADIAQQFNLPNAVIGAVAMLTQLGYAFGLLLISATRRATILQSRDRKSVV